LIDPENEPALDPATSVTCEETASLSVLLLRLVQLDGSVIVAGEPIEALSPVPETERTETVTVALFWNVFVPVALPLRLIATSAPALVALLTQTVPNASGSAAIGVALSPSGTVVSAKAPPASAAITATATQAATIAGRSLLLLFPVDVGFAITP
jgi:hypothetical protein